MNRVLLSQPLDDRLPTRLFRAASPSDMVCAALVAGQLSPGNHLLAMARDKSQADSKVYGECFESLVPLHDWRAVVDISGWSMTRDHAEAPPIADRWRHLWKARESMAELRRWIAPIVGVAPGAAALERVLDQCVDELYLTCLNHFDVRALYRVFPSARKLYYPHTLDSLAPSEADHYERYCSRQRWSTSAFVRDSLKRVVLGSDSVPVRHTRIDKFYTFRCVPVWTHEHTRLDVALSPAAMAQLFDRLPAQVRSYYGDLSRRCGADVGVLLLNPDDFGEQHPYASEVDGYLHLARELRRQGARTILVKPHSRSSVHWNDTVRSALEAEHARLGTDLIFVEEFYHYPIEITIAPVRAVACAGMGTTCLGTLRRIYGMAAYCAEERMLRINAWNVDWRDNFRVWVEDYGKDYVAV